MCGISGIIDFENKVQEQYLVKINDCLSHRGPDHGGTYIDPKQNVGLAQRRLSIIDLSVSGNQPMCNETKDIWLVYNGEVYNFRSIKKELETLGHIFSSNTDSEVIIHGYEEWGEKVLDKLNGMFAFAIWDEKKQKLFAARDRVGIKPFFYYYDEKQFIFASELKAIMAHPLIDKTINESAIYDYFTYRYIPTPKTILQYAFKLPPGHFLILQNKKIEITEYWDVDFSKPVKITEQEAVRLVKEQVEASITSHLISDVPVGIFLSGGIDSSVVASYMRKHTAEKICSFTIGFSNWKNNETPYAKKLADKLGFEHKEEIIDYTLPQKQIDMLTGLFDEPFSDSSSIPTYYVSKTARQKVIVALSGDGGDEIFGGYNWYTEIMPYFKNQSRLKRIPFAQSVFSILNSVYPFEKGKGKLRALGSDFWDFYCYKLNGFTKKEKQKVLLKEFTDKFKDYDDYWYFKKYWKADLDPFTRMQYLDMKTYLNDDILTKVDRASMAVSLEVRVPLLDHKLIELVASLPIEIRNKGHEKKYLFKKAIVGVLDEELLNKEKTGFNIPMENFFSYADIPQDYDAGIKKLLKKNPESIKKEPHYIWQVISLIKGIKK